MVTQRREDVTLDALQTQRIRRALRHVTVDTIPGKVDPFLRKETAILFAFVTLHAAVGKQFPVSAFVVVRVMAIDTRHLRLLKALTL